MGLRERLGLEPGRTDNLPEPGRCVRHGYVIDRCCGGFEPRSTYAGRPFLRAAIDAVLEEDTRPVWLRNAKAKDLTGL
jgi:hypothetical protein